MENEFDGEVGLVGSILTAVHTEFPNERGPHGRGELAEVTMENGVAMAHEEPRGIQLHQDRALPSNLTNEAERGIDHDHYRGLALALGLADGSGDSVVEQLTNEGYFAIGDFFERLRSETQNGVGNVGNESSDSFLLDDTVSDLDL